jgi:hypothetical protein
MAVVGMSLKIRLGTIVSAVEGGAVKKIEDSTPAWANRLACAKLVDAVMVEYQRYQRLRVAAVTEYGVPDTDASGQKTISVYHPSNTPEKIQAFGKAMEDLQAAEVELSCGPLPAAIFEGNLTLTVGDVRLLGALLAV